MNSNSLNESVLTNRLRARSFSVQSNIEFGEEFLKKLEKTPKIRDEFKKLLQEQIEYKKEVIEAIVESKNVKQKALLINDKRNNALLKRMNEIKSDTHFENLNINTKVDDLNVEASNIIKQVDDEVINIAVIGRRGMGKSSFINSFFNISNFDDNAIATDETECTLEPRIYKKETFGQRSTSNTDRIQIWDYPGVGTDRFPMEEYKEIVQLLPVDAYMFLYHPRFEENDNEILSLLKEEKKPFFLLRTKADLDVKLGEDVLIEELNEKWPALREKSKDDTSVTNFLKQNELDKSKYYFISCLNENRDYFDFPLLLSDLIHIIPKEKVAYLLLNLQVKSTEFFLVKHLKLREMFPNWVKAGVIGYENDENSLISFMGSKLFEIHVVFGVESSLLENIEDQEELREYVTGLTSMNFSLIELKSSLISVLFDLPPMNKISEMLLKKHRNIAMLLEGLFVKISEQCCKQAIAAVLLIE